MEPAKSWGQLQGPLKDEHERKLQGSEAGERCPPKKVADDKGWKAMGLSISSTPWSSPCWGPLLLLQDLNSHSKSLNQTPDHLRNINQAGQSSIHQTKGQSSRESHDSTFHVKVTKYERCFPKLPNLSQVYCHPKNEALGHASGLRFPIWVNQ